MQEEWRRRGHRERSGRVIGPLLPTITIPTTTLPTTGTHRESQGAYFPSLRYKKSLISRENETV